MSVGGMYNICCTMFDIIQGGSSAMGSLLAITNRFPDKFDELFVKRAVIKGVYVNPSKILDYKRYNREIMILQGSELSMFRRVKRLVRKPGFKRLSCFDLLDPGVTIAVEPTPSSSIQCGTFEFSLSIKRVYGVIKLHVRTYDQSSRDAWVSSLRSK